jgi:hypothetical protein
VPRAHSVTGSSSVGAHHGQPAGPVQ